MSYMSANICKNHIDVNYRTSITLGPSDGDPPPPPNLSAATASHPSHLTVFIKTLKQCFTTWWKRVCFLKYHSTQAVKLLTICQALTSCQGSHKQLRLSQAVKPLASCQVSHRLSSLSQAVKALTGCQSLHKLSSLSQAIKPLTSCQASHKLPSPSQAVV